MYRPETFLHRFPDHPMLISPGGMDAVIGSVMSLSTASDRPAGPKIDYHEGWPDRSRPVLSISDDIAVIPIMGFLLRRPTWIDRFFGATDYMSIRAGFDQAIADSNFRKIVLWIDSFGGDAQGIFDLADAIYAARGEKPIEALVDENALSGGYLLASCADRIHLPRTGMVGSIGVRTVHIDQSGQDQMNGLKYRAIFAGANKDDLNPHREISDREIAVVQSRVDEIYKLFVATVARNRNMKESQIAATEAAIYTGQEAVDKGLADRVASSTETFRETMMNPNEDADPRPGMSAKKGKVSAPSNVYSFDHAAKIARMADAAGCSSMTESLLAEGLNVEQAEARIATAKKVTAICAAVGMSDLAAGLIRDPNLSEQSAKAALFDKMVSRAEAAPIDSARADKAAAANDRNSDQGWGQAFAKCRSNLLNQHTGV